MSTAEAVLAAVNAGALNVPEVARRAGVPIPVAREVTRELARQGLLLLRDAPSSCPTTGCEGCRGCSLSR